MTRKLAGTRLLSCLAVLTTACNGAENRISIQEAPFQVQDMAQFDEPWAMSFLPDGRLLVTEKPGVLKLWRDDGKVVEVSGVPEVEYGGQGGLGDVLPHPDFAENRMIYLSYAEAGEGDSAGAAVARARLVEDPGGARLEDLEVIWRQFPKVDGRGHYGHRLAFGPQGLLWISSGERQKFEPAQDMQVNLGKILRLNDDGSVPDGNPFVQLGGVSGQIWSLGHRNPLGLAFDAQGRLWSTEMGPRGGDELNMIEVGGNYGYPIVSNGDHYSGQRIPDHESRPEFSAPEISWTLVISPAGLVVYQGEAFPQWQGDAFSGGLSSQTLVRIELGEEGAREAERFAMGERIREVEQGPEGNLWLLEDERRGSGGQLLRLSPRQQTNDASSP